MKHLLLILLTGAAVASAQTPAKPAAPAGSPTKPATTATHPAAAGVKLPPGVPPARGILKTAFSLRYQDTKIGTGADAEPNKLYKVLYTGWRASDGIKFDSSSDHRQPVTDKDGKPVMGDDGKPKLGDPQPFQFAQGMGPGRGPIPGFDQGFYGMKVGGKRRLFIPWQLAYGTHEIPAHGTDHPGIPAKSDLIFDVELVDVAELPARPTSPGRPMPPGAGRPGVPPASGVPPGTAPRPGTPIAPGAAPAPGAPPQSTPPQSSAPPPSAAPGQTPAPPASATPPQPTTPPQQ
jgi:peptidylprolyl isomerase